MEDSVLLHHLTVSALIRLVLALLRFHQSARLPLDQCSQLASLLRSPYARGRVRWHIEYLLFSLRSRLFWPVFRYFNISRLILPNQIISENFRCARNSH